MFSYVKKYFKKPTKKATKKANKETEVTTKEATKEATKETKVTVHDNGKTRRYLKSFENKFKQIKKILDDKSNNYIPAEVVEGQSALAEHLKKMTKIIKEHPETIEAEQAQQILDDNYEYYRNTQPKKKYKIDNRRQTQIENYLSVGVKDDYEQKIKTPSVNYQGVPLRL